MTESKNKNNNQRNDFEDEISIAELFSVLISHKYRIVFYTLLGALLLNAFALFAVTPTYESTSKLYIVSTSNGSVVDLSDLNIGTSLTSDYEQLIMSYPVLDEVIDDLDLEMSYEDLAKKITLNNPTDTRILCITATTTDAQLSMDIANDLARVTVKYLPDTMSTNPPNIAQKARLEEKKVAPSYSKYTVLGALIGMILSCLYFILLFMMDDTVRSAEDMEKAFGVTSLTSIPRSEALMDEKNNSHKKKSGKKGEK